MRLLRLALEESSDGNLNKEIEHVWYCKISDLTQLEKATDKEHQEQWEIKIPKTENNVSDGRMRVRLTIKEGKEEYVYTVKTKADVGINEVSIPTTEAMFHQFAMMAPKGMIKERFFFKDENSDFIFELDMYFTDTPKYQQWCRLELETKNITNLIPTIPLQFDEIIQETGSNMTPADRAKVTELFETVFLTKNKYLKIEI